MMNSNASSVEQLQDLLIGTANIEDFLSGLCAFAAATVAQATGSDIEVAVTLKRRRRTSTIAGSSPRAIELDHIEQSIGDGPCIQGLQLMTPVVLNDVENDVR